jgi:hypothetical protein
MASKLKLTKQIKKPITEDMELRSSFGSRNNARIPISERCRHAVSVSERELDAEKDAQEAKGDVHSATMLLQLPREPGFSTSQADGQNVSLSGC